jgi:uncharacterized protein (DUF488 family)
MRRPAGHCALGRNHDGLVCAYSPHTTPALIARKRASPCGLGRNPAFDRARFAPALQHRGIQYVWQGDDLGRLRESGYRSYMTTHSFAAGLRRLDLLARTAPTVIMSAEASPVTCHRRFISREMTARGYRVRHIGTR